MDDAELLKHYARTREPEAFAQLVQRYISLVYTSARRQVGTSQAQDVTQAVFIVLARKAQKIAPERLAAWLLKTTHFACREALRRQQRRTYHEQQAAAMKQEAQPMPEEPAWDTYAPVIDEAMSRLREADRSAIALRYLRGLPLREVGQVMGVSEDAARMRVERALTKLRSLIGEKAAVPGVAGLAMALGARGVEAAPSGIVEAVVGVGGGSGAGTAGLIAKGAMKMMLWTKVKVALGMCLGLTIATGSVATMAQYDVAGKTQTNVVQVTVTGQITEAGSKTPIPGALVRGHIVVWRDNWRRNTQGRYATPEGFSQCPYQETRCDQDGRYELRFTTPLTLSGEFAGKDSLCVDASAPGRETRPLYVTPYVTPKSTEFRNVDLALNLGKLIKGRVVDDEGKPIQGARIQVDNNWNGDWMFFGYLGRTVSGQNGDFELWCSTDEDVVGDNPWLTVLKEDHAVECFWDILSKDEMGTLTFPRGATVVGRVVDASARPLAGREVVALWWGSPLARARTDQNGKYELTGMPGGMALRRFCDRLQGAAFRGDLPHARIYVRQPGMRLLESLSCDAVVEDGSTATAPDLVVK